MPTPVGPAPRDPNDPDFWDWGDLDAPGTRTTRRPFARILLFTVVLVVLASLIATMIR